MKPVYTLPLNASLEDTRKYVEETSKVLNSISFGDGTNRSKEQNTNTVFLSGNTNAVANTETGFDHVLGRVPLGFIVISLDKAAIIYKGSSAWTSTKIYLKCNVVTTAFKIILL